MTANEITLTKIITDSIMRLTPPPHRKRDYNPHIVAIRENMQDRLDQFETNEAREILPADSDTVADLKMAAAFPELYN